jgi:hypothetical protein
MALRPGLAAGLPLSGELRLSPAIKRFDNPNMRYFQALVKSARWHVYDEPSTFDGPAKIEAADQAVAW